MQQIVLAVLLGGASGLLGVAAYRFRLACLGWHAFAPLTGAVYLYSPLAAGLTGVVCGALITGVDRQVSVPSIVRGARLAEATVTVALALVWGLVFALAAWLWPAGYLRGAP